MGADGVEASLVIVILSQLLSPEAVLMLLRTSMTFALVIVGGKEGGGGRVPLKAVTRTVLGRYGSTSWSPAAAPSLPMTYRHMAVGASASAQ